MSLGSQYLKYSFGSVDAKLVKAKYLEFDNLSGNAKIRLNIQVTGDEPVYVVNEGVHCLIIDLYPTTERTVVFPKNPRDGQIFVVTTKNLVESFNVQDTPLPVSMTPTKLAAGQAVGFIFITNANKWYLFRGTAIEIVDEQEEAPR